MLKRLITTIFAIAVCVSAFAQRTAYGERMLSLTGSWTISSVGGELRYGQYLMHGFWFGDLNLANRVEIDAPTGEFVHYPRLQAGGGYMYRFWGNRTRAVNIYGGGDAFVGVEMLDLWKVLTLPTRKSFLENGFKEFQFIYGVAPRVEFEFFPFRNVAFTINGRVPITLNSKFGVLAWEVGGGVKVNF